MLPFFAALPAFVQFHRRGQDLLYLFFADPRVFWARLIYPHENYTSEFYFLS
jgi:hypothetical protein